MNHTVFNQLPDDLKRDVRCAVACGHDLLKHTHIRSGYVFVVTDKWGSGMPDWYLWKPTTDRTIWGGLLEAFPIALFYPDSGGCEVYFDDEDQNFDSTVHAHLPTAIVCEFIRRDPLGHLGRAGL